MSSEHQIFGKHIALKALGCNHEDYNGLPIVPSVNLFVKVTNGCNASCLFCSNANEQATINFDIDKLFRIIAELKEKEIYINRINITGGEPSIRPKLVGSILKRISDSNYYDDIHMHLNTNGLLAASQELMQHPRWDSISISVHHYDTVKLSDLYGVEIPNRALSFDGIDMMKVNASCNLIKNYIDSTGQVHKMMDFCLDKGFTRLYNTTPN